jgi:hypothetical protein
MSRDDRRKMWITPRELGDSLRQAVGSQLKRHVY